MMDLEFIQALIRSVDESSLDNVEIERGGTRIRLSKTPESGAVTQMMAPAAPAPSVAPVGPGAAAPTPVAPAPSPSSAPASTEAEPAGEGDGGVPSHWVEVKSPMVGTFYRAPSPGADPFTEVGARVAPGEALCIIEAMKLMNELEAEITGTVREILVENGEPVEYGQVLFRVEPA